MSTYVRVRVFLNVCVLISSFLVYNPGEPSAAGDLHSMPISTALSHATTTPLSRTTPTCQTPFGHTPHCQTPKSSVTWQQHVLLILRVQLEQPY